MNRQKDVGAAAPRMNAPEVMMPQGSRAEMDRLVALMGEQEAAEQWAMRVFMQGMEFHRTLTAAGAAVAGA